MGAYILFSLSLCQGGLVWSPYAAEDTMDALYPDLAQVSTWSRAS